MTLTEEQRRVVEEKHGLFTVLACPGSGKTYTVAARLHRLLSTWRSTSTGIASLSFTNVACEEVVRYLAEEFKAVRPAYPHFLGTLDAFINRYIFLPFGHLVMGCAARPTFYGPPHDDNEPIGTWLFWKNPECYKRQCKMTEFTFDPKDRLVRVGHQRMGEQCGQAEHQCAAYKERLVAMGRATQSDANYFARRVLLHHPELAAAIALRFPVLIVDEAQDTSATQLAVLDLLVQAGLREMALVGDPDQAIYEWRDADPALFLAKNAAWRENSVALTANWRSSQGICDCASRLSLKAGQMRAVNDKVASFGCDPLIIGYRSVSDLPAVALRFSEYCDAAIGAGSHVNVLVRSNDLLNEIAPGTVASGLDPWRRDSPYCRPIAQARYLLDLGCSVEAVRAVQRAEALRTRRRDGAGKSVTRWSVADLQARGRLLEFLYALPRTMPDVTLGEWVESAAPVVRQAGFEGEFRIKRRSRTADYSGLRMVDVFGQGNSTARVGRMTLRTVHQAKGTSLEAVLVVLKGKSGENRPYTGLLGEPLAGHEDLRTVYVAVTRAQRVLGIAVPAESAPRWADYLGVRYVLEPPDCSA